MWYTLEHIEIIHGWTKLAYIRMGQWVMYFNTMQIYFEKGHYFACVAFIIWAGNIWVKLAYVWVKVLKVNFPFLNWEEKTCKVAPLRDGFTIGVKNGAPYGAMLMNTTQPCCVLPAEGIHKWVAHSISLIAGSVRKGRCILKNPTVANSRIWWQIRFLGFIETNIDHGTGTVRNNI